MKVIAILIFILSFNLLAQSRDPKAISILKNFDVISYRQTDKGLKDFSVKVSVSKLTEELNEQMIFGKLKDVYFRLIWAFPNLVDVEVIGLPNGFLEIKNELKNIVLSKLDYIVPGPTEKKFDGYNLIYKSMGHDFILATDSTKMKLISEINLTFDKEGRIFKMDLLKPHFLESHQIQYEKSNNSENKWVVSKVVSEIRGTGEIQKISTFLEYGLNTSYYLPLKIETKTLKSILGKDGKMGMEKENNTTIIFDNYLINSLANQNYFKLKR